MLILREFEIFTGQHRSTVSNYIVADAEKVLDIPVGSKLGRNLYGRS